MKQEAKIVLSEGDFEWEVPRKRIAELASERAKKNKYDDIMSFDEEVINFIMDYVVWSDIKDVARLVEHPEWKEQPNMNICNVEVRY